MNELRAEGLHKSFELDGGGSLEVLRGVGLAVRPGETMAVLGVSGSGKSTLLHALGGLEHPSSGRVSCDGTDLYELPGPELALVRNRKIGFVFQLHHLLPEFDAEENVMMPCLLGGWSRARARDRAVEMLEAVGLGERRRHRPGKLSGGERQRVAIARALAPSPHYLLADEPTGNLDGGTAGAIEDLLLGLNEAAGTALLLATHNEKLAGRLDKRAYLVDGRIDS